MEIKYVDRSGGYGLPAETKDYVEEYAKVYFRIDAPYYRPFDTYEEKEKEAFFAEATAVLESLGFAAKDWYYTRGKEYLCIHPQSLSGEVKKNQIKAIAEALVGKKTFSLQCVDIYETVYDMTNEEYRAILKKKVLAIQAAVLESCKTARKTLFKRKEEVCFSVAKRFLVRRVNMDDESRHVKGLAYLYVAEVVADLTEKGYLMSARHTNGEELIRAANKKEQKERKVDVDAFIFLCKE